MKMFKKTMFVCMAALIGVGIASCSDANEYEDARTDNPSWVDNYTDSLDIPHPETLANTKWVRATGVKKNAFGKEVQGFVESVHFVSEDSVEVKMSQGATEGTWTDDSNTEAMPLYYCKYTSNTGRIEIRKAASSAIIFEGIAVVGKQETITICHYGDTPVQTYLVKQ